MAAVPRQARPARAATSAAEQRPLKVQLDVPPQWSALADRLERESWRRLIVLGAADTGKSSFCSYLGERLPALALLDSDPGQKMVGPPACVTLGTWGAGALQLRRIYFIGDTHPVGSAAAVIAAVARLAETPGLDRLVVNTGGLVVGPGIPLKRAKVDALEPEHVVAIQRGAELESLLGPLPQARVHRLRPSAAASVKRAGARKASRQSALVDALAGLRQVRLADAVIEELLRVPPPRDELRLCSFAAEDCEDRALGMIRASEYERDRLAWAAVDPLPVRRIRTGIAVPEPVVRLVLPTEAAAS